MATFTVEVKKLKIEPHTNADSLELAVVGDYRSIVRKGQFKDGDLAAYIPEQALVPQPLLQEMGLEGRLSGANKNRVKAVKLRGVVSQGLVYPARTGWAEGQDVAVELGITKYEPAIPAQFAGEQGSSPATLNYDIENFKKYPDVLKDGEEVVMTEKIHGTFFTIGLSTDIDREKTDGLFEGAFVVSSKGLIKQGIFIKDNEANAHNTYIRAARQETLDVKLVAIVNILNHMGIYKDNEDRTIWLCGEVYGRSVQKNNGIDGYSIPSGELAFRAFDIKLQNRYLDYKTFREVCEMVGIETVPLLYRGPFSKDLLMKNTSGKEAVSGKNLHIREGTVVKPIVERYEGNLGRVILKSVSDEYLMKSDGEEVQ